MKRGRKNNQLTHTLLIYTNTYMQNIQDIVEIVEKKRVYSTLHLSYFRVFLFFHTVLSSLVKQTFFIFLLLASPLYNRIIIIFLNSSLFLLSLVEINYSFLVLFLFFLVDLTCNLIFIFVTVKLLLAFCLHIYVCAYLNRIMRCVFFNFIKNQNEPGENKRIALHVKLFSISSF